MAKGKFLFGFALGIGAALAGKYLYENRDTVIKVVSEKSENIKDEVNDFVDYASEKAGKVAKEVAKFANEYGEYAKEQYSEFKNAMGGDFFEDELPADEAAEPAE